MDHLSNNNTPWHLIGSALQGDLSPEEDLEWQQWLAADVQNRELFMQLKNTWNNDLEELPAYLQADESVAWNELRAKLEEGAPRENNGQQWGIANTGRRRVRLMTLMSIAALFVIIAGIVIWKMRMESSSSYTTGNGEQQSVALEDGTLINLFPASQLEVPEGYNKKLRKVVLKNGEAFFDVLHKEIPFIVDLGVASVKDIGTSFRIRKAKDSIQVAVVSGIVELRNKTNNEVHLLKAGMRVTLLPGTGNSNALIVNESIDTTGDNKLRFINTSLPEVIKRVETVYNRKIIIMDSSIMQKRFTGNFDGLSFEGAVEVLCQSLNITFMREKDAYYLKKE